MTLEEFKDALSKVEPNEEEYAFMFTRTKEGISYGAVQKANQSDIINSWIQLLYPFFPENDEEDGSQHYTEHDIPIMLAVIQVTEGILQEVKRVLGFTDFQIKQVRVRLTNNFIQKVSVVKPTKSETDED